MKQFMKYLSLSFMRIGLALAVTLWVTGQY
jgi:hypothetical protein